MLGHGRVTQSPVAGGSADVHKCYEDLERLILYRIVYIAGVPDRILAAYMSFLEESYTTSGWPWR